MDPSVLVRKKGNGKAWPENDMRSWEDGNKVQKEPRPLTVCVLLSVLTFTK